MSLPNPTIFEFRPFPTWQTIRDPRGKILHHSSILRLTTKPVFSCIDKTQNQNHTKNHILSLKNSFHYQNLKPKFTHTHIVARKETMGCAQSKRIEATVATDVYRPAPTSFALFDINGIEEPWNKGENEEEEEEQQQQEKDVHVPAPILEKLNKFEHELNGPQSWSEVSKALEDLKPTLHNQKPTTLSKPTPMAQDSKEESISKPPPPKKNHSFHTLAELDSKISSNSPDLKKNNFKQAELNRSVSTKNESGLVRATKPDSKSTGGTYKPVKENLFILRDKLERERLDGVESVAERLGLKFRRDPLKEYPEKCPPGGMDKLILYTTSLRGVRRTFEDCNQVKSIIEGHRVVFDERDVSLHGEFLNELRELLGEEVSVPRLFVKGRYIGGVDKVLELNESNRLSQLLHKAGIERGLGCAACEGCGGVRFIPCLECGGSCKVVVRNVKERCGLCNENGLVQCPVCH